MTYSSVFWPTKQRVNENLETVIINQITQKWAVGFDPSISGDECKLACTFEQLKIKKLPIAIPLPFGDLTRSGVFPPMLARNPNRTNNYYAVNEVLEGKK